MASQPITTLSHRRFLGAFLLSGVLVCCTLLSLSHAAFTTSITPDGTLGTSVGVPTAFGAGKDYAISGGTKISSNLFHSFQLFSVGTGDRASFTGLTGITNILSRVTGGQQSMIDGFLRTTTSGVNLYLVNPAGVLFGPNARLTSVGSLHVSTADYLRFNDGGPYAAKPKFYADPARASVLTALSPDAFGFLGSNPAAITVQGTGTGVASNELLVQTGKTISVVGGDIQIPGKFLTAPKGVVQIASV